MKSRYFRSIPGALAALALAAPGVVQAQTPIKIGVLVPLSGPQAEYGAEITGGMKVYMKEAGDVVAGRKIELVIRDSGSPSSPDVAKRLATELITRDRVELLAGFGFTPDALSVAPVATEAKVPMVVMNAATSVITTRSQSVRALLPESVAEAARRYCGNVRTAPSLPEALRLARTAVSKEGVIVVTGSLYLVGEALLR
jgi:branched-chain amino acid transport system substrate-binding protein